MTREELLKKIDDRIAFNNYQIPMIYSFKEDNVVRNNTAVLKEIRKELENQSDKTYEQGANDCWEFLKTFTLLPSDGGMDPIKFKNIFGHNFASEMVKKYTYQEALAKVKTYDEENTKEEKPVVGDVVEFTGKCSGNKHIGLLYREDSDYWYSIIKNPIETPQIFKKVNWIAKKTGKHVDVEGLFE